MNHNICFLLVVPLDTDISSGTKKEVSNDKQKFLMQIFYVGVFVGTFYDSIEINQLEPISF